MDRFIGIYVVSPDGHHERVRGHTLESEARITFDRERSYERNGNGWRVVALRENWDGQTLCGTEPLWG